MESSRARRSGIAPSAPMSGIQMRGSAKPPGTRLSGLTKHARNQKMVSNPGTFNPENVKPPSYQLDGFEPMVRTSGRWCAGAGICPNRAIPANPHHRTRPYFWAGGSARAVARTSTQNAGKPVRRTTDEKGFRGDRAVAGQKRKGETVRPAPPRQRFSDLTHGADCVLIEGWRFQWMT